VILDCERWDNRVATRRRMCFNGHGLKCVIFASGVFSAPIDGTLVAPLNAKRPIMDAINAFISSVWRTGLMFGQMIIVTGFIFAMVASVQGQTSSSKPGTTKNQTHWHKYANREYGFSFSYPDIYMPVSPPGIDSDCKQNEKCYLPFLLYLSRRDSREANFWLIISPQPFHLDYEPSVEPTRQRYGGHVFHVGSGGSMGVGFTDFYAVDLKGQSIWFVFGPDNGQMPSRETKQLESRIMKTFRTF